MKRNYLIDSLRFLCAFLVVVIHNYNSSNWTVALTSMMRVAVPCFLMISGYYIYSPNRLEMQNKLLSNIRKIFIITLWATLLCALYDFNIPEDKIKWIVNFALFNDPIFGWHIWYLFAYLYVLIIVFCLNKTSIFRYWFSSHNFTFSILITSIILLSIILGRYSFLIFENILPGMITRNFLFIGLPYFLIGCYIRNRDKELINYPTKRYLYITTSLFALSLVEIGILFLSGINSDGDIFFMTAPLSISIFLLFLSGKQKDNIISKIGREYSLYIYIFHVFIGSINTYLFVEIFSPLLQSIYLFGKPIFIFILSIIASVLFSYCIKCCSKKLNIVSSKI